MKRNRHHRAETQNRIKSYLNPKFNWRRIHHSWIFWVFLVLMLGCIGYYILSVDFSFAP